MSDPTLPEEPNDRSPEAAQAALGRLEASWQGWQAAIAGVPAERFEEPGVCGSWSMRELFGHIAFWDRYGIERGRATLAGEPFQPVDADPINERETAAMADRGAAELRADMEAAHAEMMAFVAAAPHDPARLVPMLARMAVDTEHHYDEHTAEVLAWLNDARVDAQTT